MFFGADSAWKKSVPRDALTLRLSSFIWNETSKRLLMVNAVVEESGTPVSSYDLGLTIPDRLWLTSDQVYVALTSPQKRTCISFDHSLTNGTELKLQVNGTSVPVFRNEWK